MKAKAKKNTPETSQASNVISLEKAHPHAGMSAETAEVLTKVRRIMESESPLKECLTIFIHRLDYGVGVDETVTRFIKKTDRFK